MSDNRNYMNETDQEGYLKISLVNQGMFVRRKRVCPLKDVPDEEINYKNLKLLNKYITERGKIIPSRISRKGCSYGDGTTFCAIASIAF